MVLESVVADLLNRFLGDYVENLNKSQLKLGIWGGKREGAAGESPALAEGPVQLAPRPVSSPNRGSAHLAFRVSASGWQVRGAGRPVPTSAASRSWGTGPETQAPALSHPTFVGVGMGPSRLPPAWPLWHHGM